MIKRLKPTNDIIFQKLFGEKGSEGSLIALLNAILELEGSKQLTSIEIMENKELTRELLEDKTSRLDVRAKAENGIQLDIEIQLTNQKNMDKRTLYYWSKLFLEGIKKGEDYIKLAKVITINILDFNFLDIDKYHSKFHLYEDERRDFMLTDLLEVHFLEMPKFMALKEKKLREIPLHRWMMFMEEDLPEDVLKELVEMDSSIKNAEERLEYLSSDPATIDLYRKREESLHERANMISSAKAEGKAEGISEGRAAGIFEEKVGVALASFKEGLSIELVSKITGLNLDELEEIRKKYLQ